MPAWQGLLNTLHMENHDREALHQVASMPESVRIRLEGDPAYLQLLASIQSASGQNRAALKSFTELAQIYRDRNTDMPVDTQIHYGWVLLNVGDDRQLYSLVTNLSNSPDMTDDQQAQFNQLWASWSVRRANSALAAGDQRRAMAILAAAAQAFPKNADVSSALAGIYMKAGQPKQAVAIYASLDMAHATRQQYQGAIGAALSARDMKQAETWLEPALDQFKSDPVILKEAAQYEQARGNQDRAAAYYRAALDAMGPASPGLMFTQPGDTGQPGGLSPTQQLMQLLAPAGHASRTGGPLDPALDSGADGERTSVSWQDAPPDNTPTLGDFANSGRYDRAVPDAAPVQAENDAPGRTTTATEYTPTEAYLPPPRSRRRTRAIPVEVPQDNASVEYVTPVAMKTPTQPMVPAEPALQSQSLDSGLERRSNSAPYIDASETNPANRLQLAIRQMDTQESPDTGLPPVRQQPAPEDTMSALPPATNRESARVEASVLPPLTGPGVHVVRQKTPREQVEDQLAILQGAGSPWIGGASSIDYRSGQPGYDKLSIYTGQIEASSMLGPGVRGTIITRPVLLDSGTATSSTTFQQGTLTADTLPYVQSAAGIGGEFQLRAASFAASLGYTPHGFLIENVTGGIYVHPPSSHFTLTFGRDPITDTQLSYAGLRDLGSKGPDYIGNTWGGVMTNAGELQLAFGDAQSGWYIQGGGQYITGRHVEDNRRLDGDAGAYWQVLHRPEYGTLTVGMNFFGMHYDHNLRYFTYGQGGYFSPAAYMLGGVPLTFTGHYGPKFHYRVTGSIGLQAFQEDSTPYYPLDPTIQYARDNPYYPESTSVSGNYSFDGEGAYAIAEHWYVGGFLSFNNTRDYASNRGGFFVRYLFRPQPMMEENGPTGLFPMQGMRPVQVP
jgi:tetratricopeptide (TPR) repeat protein